MSLVTANPAAARCRGTYDAVLRQCEQLDEMAAQPDERLFLRAEAVSSWSVAEQLDHIARSTQAMAGAIQQALQPEATSDGRPSLVGRAILFSGWIPRRVGKAPEFTRAQTGSREDLGRLLAQARGALDRLEPRLSEIDGAPGRVNHFAFGDLTARQWLGVIRIHTNHHLKIIADIQRAAAG
ncbi:MAG TPA: DinB family protein [Gemmatimonadota bacterium]|nr:DinB family protein [Gemmatimonadota bacterium]